MYIARGLARLQWIFSTTRLREGKGVLGTMVGGRTKVPFGILCVLLSSLWGCGGGSAAPNVSRPTLTSIAISPANPTVAPGTTQQFKATATYSDNSTADVTSSANWSSSNTSNATVQTAGQSSPGLATGLAVGSAVISASFGGQASTTTLDVKALKALAISPANPTISVGATQGFKATATYSDNSSVDATASANWSSSDPNIATIQTAGQSSPGLATAAANGSANIQATYGGITALTILNVSTSGGTQTALSLSEINPSIAPNRTLQFVAVADYSNGSNQKVTALAIWTTSDPSAATVQDTGQSNPGLVTGVTAGKTATISASYGGFSKSTVVTVVSDAVPNPIMDMTSSRYLGFQGGLYENSSDTVPADHAAAGLSAAASIRPLDQNGNPSSTGAVVFLSIGMSNATIEFSAFQTQAAANPNVNHTTLAMENGAYGGVTACPWTVAQGLPTPTPCPGLTGVPAENQYDRVRDTVLATATTAPSAPPGCGSASNPCLTERQVQVVWIKNANPSPALNGQGSLSASTVCANDILTIEACNYESQLGQTIRAAKSRYPNLKQVFLSTRIYAGYALVPLNPEPYAYEYGFSAKWLIQAQIDQIRNSTVNPVAGDLNYSNGHAAWTAWGPYLWADGASPRSDGLYWCGGQSSVPCNGEDDYQSDFTHPNAQFGTPKVVNLLMKFFLNSSYTPWFRP